MREKTLEALLVQAVKSMGGLAPKFVSPGLDGMPDRIVLLPHGKIAFVEVKRMGRSRASAGKAKEPVGITRLFGVMPERRGANRKIAR